MARRLKVFRTAIGFHDALVAAPSRKAALEAWGSSGDLFAQGLAEEVGDPGLVALACASPGEVVRVSRGSAAEQIAAVGEAVEPAAGRRSGRTVAPSKTAKRAPRPSRDRVEKAEAALAAVEERLAAERERLRVEAEAVEERRRVLEAEARAERERLEAAVEGELERYRAALAAWSLASER